MRKVIFITILFSVICGNVFSQTGRKLSESEKQVFEQKMIAQSKKIKTLQCNFTQTKTSSLVTEKATAKGILLYHSPSALRWEYTEPTPSTLILNGDNATLLNKDGKKAGNEKMFKQLGGLIINAINGESLQNSKQFSTEIYEIFNSQILVVLTPVQKRLKEFYSTIELKIDAKTLLANEINLNEKSGDKTVISLTNKELNKEISQKKFEY
ncbi:MAG: outer membrane lipoprotein carrier protein LolA [Prevotellaceae bacterium]|jgi:outer membrane lipoprotein-sorting protein|nr:outer membrane lipoprotein carrier protein LolA [Prevotellaceae bacterium]